MKKIIFSLAIMFAGITTFAQLDTIENPKVVQLKLNNQEIVNIINMSKEANQENGIKDPNKIPIGQKLTFLFPDGFIGSVVAEKNDNQWKILGTKLSKLVAEHGKPVSYKEPETTKTVPPVATTVSTAEFPWWGWLIVGVVCVILFATALFRNKKKDPALDHPMVHGGVEDRNAATYMQTVAARAGFTRFGPVTKGRLTTDIPVRVAYANGNRLEKINNESVFHSKARRPDSTECDIFYKQICGNDASEIDMNHATFVPDEVQTTELQNANREIVQSEIKAAAASTAITDKVDPADVMKTVFDTLAMQKKGSFTVSIENGKVKVEAEFSNPADVPVVEKSEVH